MTIQNWQLCNDRAVIVCDSLATNGDTDRPCGFASKAFVVPHLGCMLAVKGWVHPTFVLWAGLLEPIALIPSFAELVGHAAKVMRLVGAGDPAKMNDPDTRTVLFGVDGGRVYGRIFHGCKGFEPEPFPCGRLLIPSVDGVEGERDWVTIAKAQQVADRAVPEIDRDNIGGPLLEYKLTAPAGLPRIDIRQLDVLPHYDQDVTELARQSSLAGRSGLGIYAYNYTETGRALGAPPGRQVGVMADEIERYFPEAMGPIINGFKTVRYDRLPPQLLAEIEATARRLGVLTPWEAQARAT